MHLGRRGHTHAYTHHTRRSPQRSHANDTPGTMRTQAYTSGALELRCVVFPPSMQWLDGGRQRLPGCAKGCWGPVVGPACATPTRKSAAERCSLPPAWEPAPVIQDSVRRRCKSLAGQLCAWSHPHCQVASLLPVPDLCVTLSHSRPIGNPPAGLQACKHSAQPGAHKVNGGCVGAVWVLRGPNPRSPPTGEANKTVVPTTPCAANGPRTAIAHPRRRPREGPRPHAHWRS